MENHTNSTQRFQELKNDLLKENQMIRELDRKILDKQRETDKAKEIFDKRDSELQKLHQEKEVFINRRTDLEHESRELQRKLETLNRTGHISGTF